MPKDFMAPIPDIVTTSEAAILTTADASTGGSTPIAQQSVVVTSGEYNPAYDSQSAYVNAATPNQTNFQFLPNLLDNYDVYTYHWKFFIVPLTASASGQVLNATSQTIIAESGVTDLTIDKVEFMQIATPSTESGTGTSTTIKFEIVEPSGAGLIDKMFYESIALGIGNWMVSPYWIQLEFRGRDPQSEAAIINGAYSGLGSLRWLWSVKLTGAKINVTQVGTRYEFEAMLYDEYAQTNANFSIQHNITLQNLTKFSDAMTDLENKLNADAQSKLLDNYSVADTYKIVVDPILAKYDLLDTTSNKNTSRHSDFIEFSTKAATFHPGTSVDKIIDSLLQTTPQGQMGVQNATSPDGDPLPPQQQKDKMKALWRIVTETKPIKFDPLRQDNANAYTVFVVKYDLGVLEADAAQTGQTVATEKSSLDRLTEYLSKGILKKKYNYIFTGLNDQIVQFDLNMNYSFAAATARFGGIYIDSAAGKTKGISTQDNAADEKAANEIARNALQFISNAAPGTNTQATVDAAKRKIAATKLAQDQKDRIAQVLFYAQPEHKQALAARNAADLAAATKLAKSLATPTENGLHFISDITLAPGETASLVAAEQANFQALAKGKLRPIPTKDAVQDLNTKGIDPSANAGRSRTSSMFSTALHSNLDASLVNIKLTIKGDPFWLFPRGLSASATEVVYRSNMAPEVAIKDIKYPQLQTDIDPAVNIYGTDNFIIVRFRTPKIYNNVTGVTDPYTEVESFSGVYKVIRVVNKFAVGKFTQELDCILDPVIDLSDAPVSKLLADIQKAVNTPPAVTQPTVNTTIPPTSIKTQPLSTNANLPNGTVNVTGATTTINTFAPTSSAPTSNIPTGNNLTAAQLISQQTSQL